MKNFKILMALCLFFGIALQTQAQDRKSGHVVMKVTDISAEGMDEAQLNMVKQSMESMTMDIYFEPGRSMQEVNVMGGMVKTKSITNSDGTGVMYQDMMGQKVKIKIDEELKDNPQLKQMNSMDFTNSFEEGTNVEETDEQMEIAGYKANKLNIKDANGNLIMSMWVSDDIEFDNPQSQGMEALNTVPLGIEIAQQGMSLKVMAESVSDLPKGAFEVNDEEYQEMTFDEYLKTLGQGGY